MRKLIHLGFVVLVYGVPPLASSFTISRAWCPSRKIPSRSLRKLTYHRRTNAVSNKDDVQRAENHETNGASQRTNRRRRKVSSSSDHSTLPRRAVRIYTDYAKRLWKETSMEQRERIALDKTTAAIRTVESLMEREKYEDFPGDAEKARVRLLEACRDMLEAMHATDDEAFNGLGNTTLGESKALSDAHFAETKALAYNDGSDDNASFGKEGKKKRRSVLFGAIMGFVVACWVFSGNYIFTGLFTLMTILGQLEYYRMIMNTGHFPARRISIIGACSMFLTALFAPELHQICLPMFGLWTMIWFLTMRRKVSTIPEIATTFTGMFYLGYVPSFWVRIRLIGAGREPTRLAPIMGPILERLGRTSNSLPSFIPRSIHLPITTGAIFIFWTWLCLAFSDVGAYFVGRSYGKTKLGKIAPAAGATSPNKSVEGVLGGCAVSAMLGMLGAWVQHWPCWALTGAVHGIFLGLIGLIGDLTASMLKRNAGLKDFGDLIPEHGGILDRVDSFIFTAPYSWLVCAYVIPALKRSVRIRANLPM